MQSRHHCSHHCCTNPCLLNFDILNHSPRNSGVKVRVWNGTDKAPAEIAAGQGSNNFIKTHTGHRLAPFNFILSNPESKNWAETRNRYGATDFNFPPMSRVWPSLSGIPSTLAPNLTLRNCYYKPLRKRPQGAADVAVTVQTRYHMSNVFYNIQHLYNIYNAYILKQRSIGAT